jgi:hypothetical protein
MSASSRHFVRHQRRKNSQTCGASTPSPPNSDGRVAAPGPRATSDRSETSAWRPVPTSERGRLSSSDRIARHSISLRRNTSTCLTTTCAGVPSVVRWRIEADAPPVVERRAHSRAAPEARVDPSSWRPVDPGVVSADDSGDRPGQGVQFPGPATGMVKGPVSGTSKNVAIRTVGSLVRLIAVWTMPRPGSTKAVPAE